MLLRYQRMKVGGVWAEDFVSAGSFPINAVIVRCHFPCLGYKISKMRNWHEMK